MTSMGAAYGSVIVTLFIWLLYRVGFALPKPVAKNGSNTHDDEEECLSTTEESPIFSP